jgi:hypothetical protein
VDKAIRRLFNYILLAKGFDRKHEVSFCKAYFNLPTNYVLGTEILSPFSIENDGQKVDTSDLVFRKPRLAEEYEEYARQRKDELLRELKEEIQVLSSENRENISVSDENGVSVDHFISECLEEALNEKIPKSELYMHYLRFCEKNKFIPLGRTKFGWELRKRIRVRSTRDENKFYWAGIRLKTLT